MSQNKLQLTTGFFRSTKSTAANTISHNFVHLPFFRSRPVNVLFAGYLSLLLGFPQSLWAARHLAHHRDERFRWKPVRRAWLAQGALVLALWAALLALAPKFFLAVYLPGWLLGLGLCLLQGRFEHARGAVSHYGWLYNWLFFNDGFHVEHHARPARHWTVLPYSREAGDPNASPWPAVLRWLEHASLDGLEELVCRSVRLRRFVLRVHERALARALAKMPRPRRVVIVGGGLFPRTPWSYGGSCLRRSSPSWICARIELRARGRGSTKGSSSSAAFARRRICPRWRAKRTWLSSRWRFAVARRSSTARRPRRTFSSTTGSGGGAGKA